MRGAIIGCGYISKKQLWAWSQIDDAEIVAVCDLEPERAHRRAREFGIKGVYTNYNIMFDKEELDFVDIATRPETHLELVSASAAHEIPILCQKPLAGTMEEARQIVEVCDQAGVLLMINENGRHQAWFRKMKELLEKGELGTPHNARFETRWRSTLPKPDFEGQDYFREMPQLLIFEMGVHYLDTARYLFGEATSVFAQLKQVSPHIRGEDMALVIVNHSDLACLIDGNWYSHTEPSESITWGPVRVEGTHGTMVLSNDGTLRLFSNQATQSWQFPNDTIDQSFVTTQAHFIECLRTGRKSETSGEETLKTMTLVFAAYQSATQEQVIYLEDGVKVH